MSEFEFKPDGDIPSAIYEYVNILKSTPKNPTDYHDMENILRHRMIMMVKELYGNVRVTPDTEPFVHENNIVKVSGTWYIDGYRVTLDRAPSDIGLSTGQDYWVYLHLGFKEVDFTEDQRIALDSGANSKIETSTRFAFKKFIKLEFAASTDIKMDYDGTYLLGKGLWNAGSGSWDFEESPEFTVITTPYNEAMAIIQTAVHTEYLTETAKDTISLVNPETSQTVRLQTNKDGGSGKAKAFLEEVTPTKIKLGFENEDGNHIAAFEMVKDSDEWIPILWMQPGSRDYPVAYITPSGFTTFDNRGYTGSISPTKLQIGNKFSGLTADNNQFLFRLAGKDALKATKELSDAEMLYSIVTPAAENETANMADADYSNGSRIRSGNGQSSKDAVYTFSISADDWVTDGLATINQKIVLDTGFYRESLVALKIETDWNNTEYIVVQHNQFVLLPGNIVVLNPIIFPVHDKISQENVTPQNIDVRLTYSIKTLNNDTENSEAVVGFLSGGKSIEWTQFSTAHNLVSVDTMRMNSSLFWFDDNNKLRIKKVTNSTNIADSIQAMKSNSPGTTVFSDGGIEMANDGFGSVALSLDGNRAYMMPTYDPNYVNTSGVAEKRFIIPNAEYAVHGGLLRKDQYDAFAAAAAGGDLSAEIPYPSRVCYVSRQWEPGQAVHPYYTSINTAVNYLTSQPNFDDFTERGGSVIVFPGKYNVNELDLSGSGTPGSRISITAVDPRYTEILGQIHDTNASVKAFIDIPIVAPSGKPCINITNASTIEFGHNAKITSNINNNVIKVINGTVSFYGNISHIAAGSILPSIDITSGTVKIFGNTSLNNSGSLAADAIKVTSGIFSAYDTDILVPGHGSISSINNIGGSVILRRVRVESARDVITSENQNLYLDTCTLWSQNIDGDNISIIGTGVLTNVINCKSNVIFSGVSFSPTTTLG